MGVAAIVSDLLPATAWEGAPVDRVRARGRLVARSGARAHGALIGCARPLESDICAAMAAAAGPAPQLLCPPAAGETALVAEWDSCSLDGTRVTDLAAWRRIVADDRLSDVLGAFAVAWFDDRGHLHLARDAMGERGLYYVETPNGLLFASALHPLLASGCVDRRLDHEALCLYLACAYIPGPRSLVCGVRKLQPAEHLVVSPTGALSRSEFWTLPAEDLAAPLDEAAWAALLRTELEQAVMRRLTPGTPVAATLSGGLDSSLVVALLAALHDAPVATYSISFGQRYVHELEYSSLVARHCGTRHHVIEVPPRAVMHHLDEAISLGCDPVGDPLTVPNAVLFRAAAAHSPSVFNGEGGDPCFGGPKNQPMLLSEWFGVGADGESVTREQAYLLSYAKCYRDLPGMLQPDVFDAVAGGQIEAVFAPWFSDARWPSYLNKLMAINIACKGVHHILAKVDQLGRPFGVAPQSPLFDRRIVELSLRIPPGLKRRGAVEKYVLKQAVADLLPPEIPARAKSGMRVPVEPWFRGPLRRRARRRLLDGLAPHGLFNREYLELLAAGELGGWRPRCGLKTWMLLSLESWLRHHDIRCS
jgi:asparagine synthase (glutamine-hydrolysing)